MLISLASLRGSPGVSAATLALGWVWPRHAMVAECDPMGGQALAVFDPDGSSGRRGLFQLLLDGRTTPLHQAVWRQAVRLPNGTGKHFLLAGAHSPREADSLHWARLAELFQGLNVDVLADCGRLRMIGSPKPVLQASDLTVLVVRSDQASLRTLAASLEVVREETGMVGEADDGLAAVVVEPPKPTLTWPLREVRKQLEDRGIAVLGELPWSPVAAASLTDVHRPDRRFESSPLLARAREVAAEAGRLAWARAQRLRAHKRVQQPVGIDSSVPVLEPGRGVEELVATPVNPVPQPPRSATNGEVGYFDAPD